MSGPLPSDPGDLLAYAERAGLQVSTGYDNFVSGHVLRISGDYSQRFLICDLLARADDLRAALAERRRQSRAAA